MRLLLSQPSWDASGSEQIYVKRDDKIGQTGCDKSGGCVCRGRQVKCAAGGGGDGDRIGGERVGCPCGIRKYDILHAFPGIESHGGAWVEAGAVDNPRQGSRESLSFALGR